MPKIEPYLLNLAGEYRVCSELNKRGMFATITYGNRKGADVYVIDESRNRAVKVEVKTSQQSKFVTSITQKGLADDPTAPEFWVLFHLKGTGSNDFDERFFVLTHSEICRLQAVRDRAYSAKYEQKHGKPFDPKKGVASVTINDVAEHRDAWHKIARAFEVK